MKPALLREKSVAITESWSAWYLFAHLKCHMILSALISYFAKNSQKLILAVGKINISQFLLATSSCLRTRWLLLKNLYNIQRPEPQEVFWRELLFLLFIKNYN